MSIVEVPVRSTGSQVLDDPFGVYRMVMSANIVILKGAVPAQQTLDARNAIFNWGRSTPESREHALRIRDNVHLASYLPPRSNARYIFHSYEFYLGSPNHEPDVNRFVRPVFDRLRQIYRELTADTRDYTPGTDGYALLPQCIQYPQGGGFFQEHTHDIAPQQIGLILAASEPGRDYEVGGGRFRKDITSAWRGTEGQHRLGDVCLFRYDMPHDITPVDPHLPLDWTKNSGRWSFVLPLKSAT
jgi:hypothetical protein